jgi:hypothetical protein
MPIVRKLFLNKNGKEIEITSNAQLKAFLADLTPDELEQYKSQYRFTPVSNGTGNNFYTGTMVDLGRR